MSLRLSVVSEHGIRMGPNSTKVFAVHGGTIGRGADNEWSLPDPERYLSGKHARIDFRAGNYVLVDTSSNGTYVNGSDLPLGKHKDYQLKEGDYVRIGEYELLVSIDKSNDFAPDQDAVVAYDGHSPSPSVAKSTAGDLGDELDLSELLEAGDPPSADGMEPSATPWHMMTRPLKAATAAAGTPKARAPQGGASRPTGVTDVESGLAAFCRGAGVDPRNVPGDAQIAALQLAGQLLRESVLGLMDLNQSRNDFRIRFRIPSPRTDSPDSPLDFSGGVGEALLRLLTTSSTRAGAVDAFRANFRELKAQNAASVSAMHAAFEEFLGRVDPKDLGERFDRATKRGVFGTPNKAKYWDLYGEMFAGLAQRPADGFPHSFTETFGKAYEAKLRTLVPPPRGGFGPDRATEDAKTRAVGE